MGGNQVQLDLTHRTKDQLLGGWDLCSAIHSYATVTRLSEGNEQIGLLRSDQKARHSLIGQYWNKRAEKQNDKMKKGKENKTKQKQN